MRYLLLVCSLALIGRALATWIEEVFIAYEATKYSFTLQSSVRFIEAVLGIIYVVTGGGALSLSIIHTVSWWLQALIGLALIKRYLKVEWFVWLLKDLKKIVRQGMPIGLGTLSDY